FNKVRDALMRLKESAPDTAQKLRVLWALHLTGGIFTGAKNWLADIDPLVRGWTIQLLFEDRQIRHFIDPPGRPALNHGDGPAIWNSYLEHFAEMAEKDMSPVVRRYLASVLQRLPIEHRWKILTALVQHAEDA